MKSKKYRSVLDSTNCVYVAVVNGEIHKNGSGTAVQPRVVFEVLDHPFCVHFILWKIEIESTGSVGGDFASEEHALGLGAVRVRPTIYIT